MILVDAHVHIYDCFDLLKFFDSAYSNFKSAANKIAAGTDFTAILLLAENSKDNWFSYLSDCAEGESIPKSKKAGKWQFFHTREHHSLYAKYKDSQNLILIAGRQILTSEDIEVIALATRTRFQNKLPLEESIEQISFAKGIPLIPWGVGKWLGKRGKIISKMIRSNESPLFCIGDNSGRPVFWREPHLFKFARQASIPILPGSDPLPFVSEQNRAGAFGFSIDAAIDSEKPAETIKKLVFKQKKVILAYGRLERINRFFFNQIKMQIRKKIVK